MITNSVYGTSLAELCGCTFRYICSVKNTSTLCIRKVLGSGYPDSKFTKG